MLGIQNWIPREISSSALKIEFSALLERLPIIGDMTTFFLSTSHCMRLRIKVSIVVVFMHLLEDFD